MIRIGVCLLIALLARVSAQDPAPQPAKGKVTVRFLAERAPGEIGEVVMVAGEARGKAFKLPVNHLSEAQPAPGRAFTIQPVAKAVDLASVTLPEDGKAFNVLLVPAAKGGYTPVVIPAGDPAFKAGDVYFYNHSPKTVLGFVGTAKLTLASGKGQILRPAGPRADQNYDVGFGVREKEGDRVLSKSRWPVDLTNRTYVFFFVNPKTQRVDFRAVDEFVPPEKPAP
jgi:hypothetical protein